MIRNSLHRGRLSRTEKFLSACRMTLSPRPQRPRSFAVAVASLVVVVATGLTLAAGTAAPASAATPCWKTLINDWFDGKIDHTYPRECYTQAIQHLPRDIHTYSNAADEIRAAMLATFKKGGGVPPAPPPQTSSGGSNEQNASSSTTPSASASTAAPNAQEPKQQGLILRAIEWLGPSDASAVPLPLLILAGVAFLLLAAAGGSLVNRRLQERRLPPPPQA
jgi:hypothetical protein